MVYPAFWHIQFRAVVTTLLQEISSLRTLELRFGKGPARYLSIKREDGRSIRVSKLSEHEGEKVRKSWKIPKDYGLALIDGDRLFGDW